MKLTGVELRRISMPLVAPFRTSFGVETTRDILLLRAVLDGQAEGWGECVAMSDPLYSSEYVDASVDVLKRFMLPKLFSLDHVDGAAVGPALEPFKGHWMSKAVIETAVLDAELRATGRSFARELGATKDRVPCGVSVGHPQLRRRAARLRRRVRVGRVRPDQAEDRARLGPGARPRGAGAVR